jgi:hypothetical protein
MMPKRSFGRPQATQWIAPDACEQYRLITKCGLDECAMFAFVQCDRADRPRSRCKPL